jgi:hypothetical protein
MAATELEAAKAATPVDAGKPAQGPSLTLRAINLLAARSVAFVLSFALPLLLVRRLSVEEFGLYKQVSLVVSTAYSMVPLGFGMSAYY